MQSETQYSQQETVLWPNPTKRLIVLLVVSAAALLFFRSTSAIDIFFTEPFFSEVDCETVAAGVRCGQFDLVFDPFWRFIRSIGHEVPVYLMACVCIHMAWLMIFNPNKTLADISPPLVAIISALLGPLLVVNLMLKEYWGRPRPFQTFFFGGDKKDLRVVKLTKWIFSEQIRCSCRCHTSQATRERSFSFIQKDPDLWL